MANSEDGIATKNLYKPLEQAADTEEHIYVENATLLLMRNKTHLDVVYGTTLNARKLL